MCSNKKIFLILSSTSKIPIDGYRRMMVAIGLLSLVTKSSGNAFDVNHTVDIFLNTKIGDPEITTVHPRAPSYQNLEFDRSFVPDEFLPIEDDEFTFYDRVQRTHDAIKRVEWYVENSYKIYIMLRGCPGSSKSSLAKTILKKCNITNNTYMYIHSADNFFYLNTQGQYIMERDKIVKAHEWNGKNILSVVRQGLTPIIVDNTNTRMWHMEQYASNAVLAGYAIEVIEPDTPWAFDINQLMLKSTHDIPRDVLYYMLKNYEYGVTATTLLEKYNLEYPYERLPPQKGNRALSDPGLIRLFEDIDRSIHGESYGA